MLVAVADHWDHWKHRAFFLELEIGAPEIITNGRDREMERLSRSTEELSFLHLGRLFPTVLERWPDTKKHRLILDWEPNPRTAAILENHNIHLDTVPLLKEEQGTLDPDYD